MKHLKSYNESDVFEEDPDISSIKEIIREIKYDYPSIEGEITTLKELNRCYTIIKLKPLPVYNDATTKLDNLDKRMKYFKDIIECCKRLQEVLDREVRLQHLFNTDGDTINIWIDDFKNKGKKLRGL